MYSQDNSGHVIVKAKQRGIYKRGFSRLVMDGERLIVREKEVHVVVGPQLKQIGDDNLEVNVI